MGGETARPRPPARWSNAKGRIEERARARLAEEGVAPSDLGALAVWAEREARLLAEEASGRREAEGRTPRRRRRPPLPDPRQGPP
jgi:hypothetical protein